MKTYIVIKLDLDDRSNGARVLGVFVTKAEAFVCRNKYIAENWGIEDDEEDEDFSWDLKQDWLDNDREALHIEEATLNLKS